MKCISFLGTWLGEQFLLIINKQLIFLEIRGSVSLTLNNTKSVVISADEFKCNSMER